MASLSSLSPASAVAGPSRWRLPTSSSLSVVLCAPSSHRRRKLHTTPPRRDAGDPDLPGLTASLPHHRYCPMEPSMQVDHLVIGGGVVGLATAAYLARRYPEKSTYLVERHRRAGEETSSRNSEVIHAGLYYPADSLKTQMCIRGRELMYKRCAEWGVPHKQVGKLVVGPQGSKPYFEKMQQHVASLGPLAPPLKLISGDEARQREPDLSRDIEWAMWSDRTGIVSSHELMESFEREIMDSEGAELVYDTEVVRIDPHLPDRSAVADAGSKRGSDDSQEGWVVQTVTHSDAASSSNTEADAILARVVINSSGLNGQLALNALRGDDRFAEGQDSKAMGMWYAKGNYVSYKGPGVKRIKSLVYPIPAMSSGGGLDQGLGTHLTVDLAGNIRFGPDTEWLRDTKSLGVDFWKTKLAPVTSEERLEAMHRSIRAYLPEVSREGLSPDYAGIRPKLVPPGGGFMDFTLLQHRSRDLASQPLWSYARLPSDELEAGTKQFRKGPTTTLSDRGTAEAGGTLLTMAGIESPGLTSSMALAELVGQIVAKTHGYAEQTREKEQVKEIPRGARNEDVGGAGLDAWA